MNRSESMRKWRSGRNPVSASALCYTEVLLCNPIKVWPGWVCRAPQGTPLVVPGRRPGCWQLLLSGSLYQASVTSHLLHLWHRQKSMNVILMWEIINKFMLFWGLEWSWDSHDFWDTAVGFFIFFGALSTTSATEFHYIWDKADSTADICYLQNSATHAKTTQMDKYPGNKENMYFWFEVNCLFNKLIWSFKIKIINILI